MTDREISMLLLWENVLRLDRDIQTELRRVTGRPKELGWLAWAIHKRGRLAAEWHTINGATGAAAE